MEGKSGSQGQLGGSRNGRWWSGLGAAVATEKSSQILDMGMSEKRRHVWTPTLIGHLTSGPCSSRLATWRKMRDTHGICWKLAKDGRGARRMGVRGGEYLRVTPIRLLRSSMAAVLAMAQAGWGTPPCSSHSK